MIHIEERHLKIIQEILSKYPYHFYVFGSRSKGTHRKLSDLDLCYMENIPLNIRSHIDEDFENSDLPFKIDMIDWHACDDTFKKSIQNDLVIVQDPATL